MAKRKKSSAVLIAGNLGHHALVFDEDDVVRLLRPQLSAKEVKAFLQSATRIIATRAGRGAKLRAQYRKLDRPMARLRKPRSRLNCENPRRAANGPDPWIPHRIS